MTSEWWMHVQSNLLQFHSKRDDLFRIRKKKKRASEFENTVKNLIIRKDSQVQNP
jgi:hypothetical protein